MNDSQIIEMLFRYGHFRGSVIKAELPLLKISDKVVQEALLSYQYFAQFTLDQLALKHHNRAAIIDGIVGPATRELFTLPRCEVPDYGEGATAVGSGSWPEPCQKGGVKFFVNKANMPSGLVAKWAERQAQIVRAYGLVGVRMVEVAVANDANIYIHFRSFFGSTIGLSEFNNESCSDHVDCALSSSYVGNDCGLPKHEIGHCMNLGHTRGGTMNPYITPEINADGSWANSDPSLSTLKRYFGGTPIDGPNPPPPPPPPPVTPPPSRPFLDFLRRLFGW